MINFTVINKDYFIHIFDKFKKFIRNISGKFPTYLDINDIIINPKLNYVKYLKIYNGYTYNYSITLFNTFQYNKQLRYSDNVDLIAKFIYNNP